MPITELMKFRRTQRKVVAGGKSAGQSTGKDPNAPEGEEEYKPLEWPVIRKILHWMRPYRKQYTIALLLNIAFSMCEMSGPLFVKHLADHDVKGDVHFLSQFFVWIANAFSAGSGDRFEAMISPRRAFWNVGFTIGLWATAILCANLIARFNIEYNRRVGENVLLTIRKAVFAHLQRLSMSYYDRTKFGRILSRGTSDIDALANPIINGINTVVVSSLTMLIAAAMLLFSEWHIALAVLWLGPVLYLMNQYFRRMIGAKWRVVREGYTRVSTNLAENINGMRVVTAYNRQEENLTKFNVLQEHNTQNNISAALMNGVYQPLLSLVGYMGKVIILILGAYMVMTSTSTAGGLTVGALIALTMYWDWFMGPVLAFGVFHNEMMMSMASAERVFALLDLKPEVQDMADAIVLPRITGQVTFENVHFAYIKDKPVLHDISFTANPGQTIALVGHTGCGKSTIMNLICRFYLPASGRVMIDGHDLAMVNSESLHKQMGIVSQANYLFSGTVLDNIRYASPDATEAEVIAGAKALGSHDILMSLKDGYQTQVGERGASMSLGQRQLICFTRAFLANPRILMLDEATSAVDTHTEKVIQDALERLILHRTTFIVAHRLSTVVNADLVIVMDHGRIIERGTHAQLITLNGKYAELYKQFTREI